MIVTPSTYLDQLKTIAISHPQVVEFRVTRERVSKSDAYIRALPTFVDGSRLEAMEYVRVFPDSGLQIERYSYHWMGPDNQLRIRWDNAEHYPDLDGFPHHRHDGDERNALPGEPMNFLKVLDHITSRLNA